MNGHYEIDAPLAVRPTPAPGETLADVIAADSATPDPDQVLQTIIGQIRTLKNENVNTLIGSQLTYVLGNLTFYQELVRDGRSD